jgi:hypothetical protein
VGITNNRKTCRRLATAVDRLRLVPERQLGFFNRWLVYMGFLVTALPGPAGCRQFLHGRSRLSATGVIVLLEKGTKYG